MADISDVEQALVNLIDAVLYPAGTAQPSAIIGAAPVIVTRGWPLPTDLDRDLPAGKSHVTVWPRGGTEHNTTRYPVDYQEVSRGTPTLTVAVANNVVTIGGTNDQSVSQFVTLQIGPRVVVGYQPSPTDAVSDIAAALAAQITAAFAIAVAVGGAITIQSNASVRAIVGVTGVQLAEARRQKTQVQIVLWCPSPSIRDSIAKLIEPVLALTTFLIMPDTSACRLLYASTLLNDDSEKPGLYRRDMLYYVEYATTVSDVATEVTVVPINEDVTDGFLGIAPPVTFNAPKP